RGPRRDRRSGQLLPRLLYARAVARPSANLRAPLTAASGQGHAPRDAGVAMTKTVLALVCVLAAPAFADTQSEVKAHEAVFARACQAGDVKAAAALFADDAV